LNPYRLLMGDHHGRAIIESNGVDIGNHPFLRKLPMGKKVLLFSVAA
jgi:hypothetical protein